MSKSAAVSKTDSFSTSTAENRLQKKEKVPIMEKEDTDEKIKILRALQRENMRSFKEELQKKDNQIKTLSGSQLTKSSLTYAYTSKPYQLSSSKLLSLEKQADTKQTRATILSSLSSSPKKPSSLLMKEAPESKRKERKSFAGTTSVKHLESALHTKVLHATSHEMDKSTTGKQILKIKKQKDEKITPDKVENILLKQTQETAKCKKVSEKIDSKSLEKQKENELYVTTDTILSHDESESHSLKKDAAGTLSKSPVPDIAKSADDKAAIDSKQDIQRVSSSSPIKRATPAERRASIEISSSLPSSPSRAAGAQQILTSEVFTRTVDATGSIEVIYRQPEALRRVASTARSAHESATADAEISLIDTTDSSLSDSVALPSSSSEHDFKPSGSPASPKPTRRSLEMIHDKVRSSDLFSEHSVVLEHDAEISSVQDDKYTVLESSTIKSPIKSGSRRTSKERLSPILDVRAISPPRIKHKFHYEDYEKLDDEEEEKDRHLPSPGLSGESQPDQEPLVNLSHLKTPEGSYVSTSKNLSDVELKGNFVNNITEDISSHDETQSLLSLSCLEEIVDTLLSQVSLEEEAMKTDDGYKYSSDVHIDVQDTTRKKDEKNSIASMKNENDSLSSKYHVSTFIVEPEMKAMIECKMPRSKKENNISELPIERPVDVESSITTLHLTETSQNPMTTTSNDYYKSNISENTDSKTPNKNKELLDNLECNDKSKVCAEIKLLVKTLDSGRESLEIRSVREFIDPNLKNESKAPAQTYNNKTQNSCIKRLCIRSPQSGKCRTYDNSSKPLDIKYKIPINRHRRNKRSLSSDLLPIYEDTSSSDSSSESPPVVSKWRSMPSLSKSSHLSTPYQKETSGKHDNLISQYSFTTPFSPLSSSWESSNLSSSSSPHTTRIYPEPWYLQTEFSPCTSTTSSAYCSWYICPENSTEQQFDEGRATVVQDDEVTDGAIISSNSINKFVPEVLGKPPSLITEIKEDKLIKPTGDNIILTEKIHVETKSAPEPSLESFGIFSDTPMNEFAYGDSQRPGKIEEDIAPTKMIQVDSEKVQFETVSSPFQTILSGPYDDTQSFTNEFLAEMAEKPATVDIKEKKSAVDQFLAEVGDERVSERSDVEEKKSIINESVTEIVAKPVDVLTNIEKKKSDINQFLFEIEEKHVMTDTKENKSSVSEFFTETAEKPEITAIPANIQTEIKEKTHQFFIDTVKKPESVVSEIDQEKSDLGQFLTETAEKPVSVSSKIDLKESDLDQLLSETAETPVSVASEIYKKKSDLDKFLTETAEKSTSVASEIEQKKSDLDKFLTEITEKPVSVSSEIDQKESDLDQFLTKTAKKPITLASEIDKKESDLNKFLTETAEKPVSASSKIDQKKGDLDQFLIKTAENPVSVASENDQKKSDLDKFLTETAEKPVSVLSKIDQKKSELDQFLTETAEKPISVASEIDQKKSDLDQFLTERVEKPPSDMIEAEAEKIITSIEQDLIATENLLLLETEPTSYEISFPEASSVKSSATQENVGHEEHDSQNIKDEKEGHSEVLSEHSKTESFTSVPYVTTPTLKRRGLIGSQSLRLDKNNRPAPIDVTNLSRDDEFGESDYIVTEPEEVTSHSVRINSSPEILSEPVATITSEYMHNEAKEHHRPLFHIESEDDDSFGQSSQNIDEVVKHQEESVLHSKYADEFDPFKETDEFSNKFAESSVLIKTKTLVETPIKSEALIESEAPEDKHDMNLELKEEDKDRKLRRVERRFERMASETNETGNNTKEFECMVSQLSTEEVAEYEKEYLQLLDEGGLTPSEDWESKDASTPSGELNEVYIHCESSLALDTEALPKIVVDTCETASIHSSDEEAFIPLVQSRQPYNENQKQLNSEGNLTSSADVCDNADSMAIDILEEALAESIILQSNQELGWMFQDNSILARKGDNVSFVNLSREPCSVEQSPLESSRITTQDGERQKSSAEEQPLSSITPKPLPRVSPPSPAISSIEDDAQSYSDKKKFWEQVSAPHTGQRTGLVPPKMSEVESDTETTTTCSDSTIRMHPPPDSVSKQSTFTGSSDGSESDLAGVPTTVSSAAAVFTRESQSHSSDSEAEYFSKEPLAYDNSAFVGDEEKDAFEESSLSKFPIRKSLYERSVSLPTEDLVSFESNGSVRAKKRYFEAQIKKEMVVEQLMTQLEEEASPEHKAIKSVEYKEKIDICSKVKDLAKGFESEPASAESKICSDATEDILKESALDKSEIEETEKEREEYVPSITVTLSGKRRRQSDESVDTFSEPDVTPEECPPLYQPQEHLPDTIWEVPVQEQAVPVEEEVQDIPTDKQIIVEKEEEFKLTEEEAREIAKEVIESIEEEVSKRPNLYIPPVPPPEMAENQVSEYLKKLTGKDELEPREMQLMESVLAKKYREKASRFSRTDTTTSSVEITDEDLRSSGVETDLSPLESQTMKLQQIEDMTLSQDTIPEVSCEEVVEQTLAEVCESLEAAQETLIEEHKSKKEVVIKKESPSEFEFKGLSTEKRLGEEMIEESHFEETSGTIEYEESTADGKHVSHTTDILVKDKQELKEDKTVVEKESVEIRKDETKVLTQTFVEEKEKSDLKSEKITLDDVRVETDKERKDVLTTHTSAFFAEEDTKNFESKLEHTVRDGILTGVISEEKQKDIHIEESDVLIQEKSKDMSVTRKEDTMKLKSEIKESKTEVSGDEFVETSHSSEISKSEQKIEEAVETKKMFRSEEIKRTSSEESQESFKSPVEVMSSSSSTSGQRGETVRVERPDGTEATVVLRHSRFGKVGDGGESSSSGGRSTSALRADRRSGAEFDGWSSSGESHYHSVGETYSRPCSSDVELLMAGGVGTAGSSEYESALTSQEFSSRTSQEYHTAVSSLSSRESMRSLDSESSGHLASVEISSEASETLVPSAQELERDMEGAATDDDNLEIGDRVIEPYDRVIPVHVIRGEVADGRESPFEMISETEVLEYPGEDIVSEDDLILEDERPHSMKRSHEMIFQPEPRTISPLSDSPIELQEDKLGSSLEDGSILSVSLSSTSEMSAALQTVIELSRADSDSADADITVTTQTQTHITPTTSVSSVTITTSVVDEEGIQSVCTQVTSQSHTPVPEGEDDLFAQNGPTQVDYIPEYDDYEDTKKKPHSHRRTESVTGFVVPKHVVTMEDESEKISLTLKEVHSDEKKDIDEAERPLGFEDEADIGEAARPLSQVSKSDSEGGHRHVSSGLSDDRPDSELSELMREYSTEGEKDVDEDPIARPLSPEPIDEMEIKDDTPEFSSEAQASVTELEMEYSGAFSRVSEYASHVSPIQEIPVGFSEKHELETSDIAVKEDTRRIQDSSSPIPDITVTQHMTPLVDEGFSYPDTESEVPQTPSVTSSETETDQGREYVLQEPEGDDYIAEEAETSGTDEKTVYEGKKKPEKAEDAHSDSSHSDSFEMLEKPDLTDEYVVIEEVGREAEEHDTEGKSMHIQSQKVKAKKRGKKTEEEEEDVLVPSPPAPATRMTDIKYYPSDEGIAPFPFESEESPPTASDGKVEYEKDLEAGKKWVEMQFQGDSASSAAAAYGYEMDFERAPLEDIKEEEISDFDQSSKVGSIGSYRESVGSFGSVKDSFGSTPEYDVLAGKKFFTRSGDNDDISMSSLQEFEQLEKQIALEQAKRRSNGSQDSLSGSTGSKKLSSSSRSGQGDDVSLSSLREFEGLETACIEVEKIESKAKQEEALLSEIEEGHESQISESESCETMSVDAGRERESIDSDDYEKRMFEIDEIIRQAQSNVERFTDPLQDNTESVGRGDSMEEVARIPELDLDQPFYSQHGVISPTTKSILTPGWKDADEDIMETSVDSLDVKTARDVIHGSADSLDLKTGDIMSASADSIELQSLPADSGVMATSVDSLELGGATSSGPDTRDSVDDIQGHDQSSSSGREGDLSSSGKDEHGGIGYKSDFMLGSTDSLDPSSSTATHATYQYETDSVMSSSFTSGGSNTMVSSTEDPNGTGCSGPYVTEIIEPSEEDEFSHTIRRTVEMPPEIRKVTFSGPNAEQELQEYVGRFAPGEDTCESQEVDEYGNVHITRTIQRRIVVKEDDTESDYAHLLSSISSPTIPTEMAAHHTYVTRHVTLPNTQQTAAKSSGYAETEEELQIKQKGTGPQLPSTQREVKEEPEGAVALETDTSKGIGTLSETSFEGMPRDDQMLKELLKTLEDEKKGEM